MVLHEHAEKREVVRLKIMASLHGVDTKGWDAGGGSDGQIVGLDGKPVQKPRVSPDDNKGLIPFRDPKEYEKMSPEKRQALTDKMMGAYKKWGGGAL